MGDRSTAVRWARRLGLAAVVLAQVTLLVHGASDPQRAFGFQMFRESSSWQARIVRVTASGDRVDVREPWPGGYAWADLVQGHGLDRPWLRQHASNGVAATVHLLDGALDWVATHTPRDHETVRLEARITTWRNERAPTTQVLRSPPRPEARP